MNKKVSVIITTKNEEWHIKNCLESIKGQTYPQINIEVIVVDNNSSDRTKDVALTYTQNIFNFGPERSAQRNFGVRHANGEYILYLDADMILSCDTIVACIKKCTEGKIDGLYIPEKIIGNGFWIKVRNFERSFYNGTCIDAVRFIRRDAFLKVNGFDENLTGPEDWDLDRRIKDNGVTAIAKTFLYHNEDGFNLKKYLKKKNYYTKTINTYTRKWGKGDKIVGRQLGFLYRFFFVFLEHKKWHKLAKHPVLTVSLFFLRFLVGCYFLLSKLRSDIINEGFKV